MKNDLLKNLTVLVSGSVVAQLVGVLAAPLLSRLYTPEDFGVVGTVMSIVAVLSVILTLQYEKAIVLESDDSAASLLKSLCWRVLCLISSVVLVVVILLAYFGLDVSGDSNIILWVVPIAFLLAALSINVSWCNRERYYKLTSISSIARRLTVVVTQIILGFCGAQALGLILGNILGLVAAVVIIVVSTRTRKKRVDNDVRLADLALKYYKFPILSVPQRLLNSASSQLPVFILGHYFGFEIVGAYWFAIRLLQLPATLISKSVSNIFYRDAVDLKQDLPRLKKLYLKITGSLTLVILLPSVVVFCWGPEIYSFLFGQQWAYAGNLAGGIVIWVAFLFINAPAMVLFTVFQKLRMNLIFDVFLFMARSSVLIFLSIKGDPLSAVIMYSVVSALFDIFAIGYWWRYLSRENNSNV